MMRLQHLGLQELEVVDEFTARLLAGQRTYGLLREAKRDWDREAHEEFLDAAVYAICARIDDRKRKAKQWGKAQQKGDKARSCSPWSQEGLEAPSTQRSRRSL